MSLKPAKVLIISGLSLLASTGIFAQNIDRPFENNPYSRYGLGEEQNAINPAIKAMGSITAAYADPYIINTDNPASYATIKYFNYEAGFEGRTRTILTANDKYHTGNATVSYLNIAVPMGKYAGMLIGFRPQTKVGYSLYDTLQTALGSSSKSYTGDGATNNFFIGGAGKYKGFSLGANVGYIFGNIFQTSFLKTTSTSLNLNNAEFTRISSIGGMYFKLGAQYENKISKDYTIRVGMQADLKQNISSELDEYWISHPYYASDTTGADTSFSNNGGKEKITLPSTFVFGIQLAKSDKWNIGVNYKTTNWSQFNNHNIKDSIGANAYKVSIGGAYTPNAQNTFKYWQKVTYRAGFYYGKDFVSINNKQANYFAATFGLSLPFNKRIKESDCIHTAFEIGKMGNLATNALQQNFVRFSVGITFNGKPKDGGWFYKRKYD